MSITGSSFPRLPICFCLDLTESMAGKGIEDAKNVLRSFQKASVTALENGVCIETAILTFSNSTICVKKFEESEASEDKIGFDYAGGRASGFRALHKCLDLIERRKKVYVDNGISFRRPWVILISDGRFAPPEQGNRAKEAEYIKELIEAKSGKKCWFVPIQAGDCDIDRLAKCCFAKEAVTFENLDLETLVQTLSVSISQSISRANEDQNPVEFLLKDIHKWGQIGQKGEK